MWAPASSSARKEASRPVRRSGFVIAGDCPPSDRRRESFQQCWSTTFNNVYNARHGDGPGRSADLPAGLRGARAWRPRRRDAHPRQRRPGPGRRAGRVPAHLAPSRLVRRRPRRDRLLPAHDGPLARARPVARGPGRRPRLGPPEDRREHRGGADRGHARADARARRHARDACARRCGGCPSPSARRSCSPTGAASPPTRSPAASTCRWARPRAASGSAWRGCARNALHWRSTPPRTASLHSNVRSTAEPAGHEARPGEGQVGRAAARRPAAVTHRRLVGRPTTEGGPRFEAQARLACRAVRRRALFRLYLRGRHALARVRTRHPGHHTHRPPRPPRSG